MLDRDRILGKIDELDTYLAELAKVVPSTFAAYRRVEKKRSCERLLQLCVETTIDICRLFVTGLKLGLPGEENDLFDKLRQERIISGRMTSLLKRMRGFRNILIHEYAAVDDEIVFRTAARGRGDFLKFKKEILKALGKPSRRV